jgi:hypothetical protein
VLRRFAPIIGAILPFIALAIYAIVRSPKAKPRCSVLKPLTIPTDTPDPNHAGKTIAQRAYEVLDAYPLGLDVDQYPVEQWLGHWVRFVVEIHPPDSGIAVNHKGVTVKECNLS